MQPLYTAPPAPVVPETLPCPVHLEPGLKFGKGVRTQCLLDALRRRADYYAELEAMTPEQRAEHDARIAEFKSMLGKTDAIESTFEAWFNSPEAGMRVVNYDIQRELQLKAWNACRAAMLQAGNSPVIPDCWIPVSERMPERDVDVQIYCADKKEQMVGYMERNETEGWFRFASLPNGGGVYCQPTHWMPLPAAPQQEMK
ncbi:DUF551 domain-containing protein [Citrobacter freundii]